MSPLTFQLFFTQDEYLLLFFVHYLCSSACEIINSLKPEGIALQKEVKSMQNSQAGKDGAALKPCLSINQELIIVEGECLTLYRAV